MSIEEQFKIYLWVARVTVPHPVFEISLYCLKNRAVRVAG